jgi:pentatricopeptide repeat protein
VYIFDQLNSKLLPSNLSIGTWTAIIYACYSNKQTNRAWELFQEMERAGIVPNENLFSTILSVLGDMENLHEGQRIYQQLQV